MSEKKNTEENDELLSKSKLKRLRLNLLDLLKSIELSWKILNLELILIIESSIITITFKQTTIKRNQRI